MTISSLVVACLVLVLVCEQSLLHIKRLRFQKQHQCFPAPKYPQYRLLWGLDLMVRNYKSWKAGRLLDQMRSNFQLAGNTYSATIAGNTTVLTIDPENIKAIFADRFNDFDAGWLRRRAFAPSIGDVLITADGARWHQQRAMLRPAFHKQQFSDFAFHERDIDSLIRMIPMDGSTIDLAPLFHIHALIITSRLLFDEPMASLNEGFSSSSTRFIQAFDSVNKGNQRRFQLGRFLPLLARDRTYEAACNFLHEYSDVFVQKALAFRKSWALNGMTGVNGDEKTKDRYIFLQEIAKEIDDPTEMRNHLLGMLLVGSETTASLLTSCLSLLSTRPHLWASLHREAIELGVPNRENVHSFASLSHVINEGMLCSWKVYAVLTLFSAPPLSNTPTLRSDGKQRHLSPNRGWTTWHFPSLCSQGRISADQYS